MTFTRDWYEGGEEPPYIMESSEIDLVRLYAVTRPAPLPELPSSD